MGHVIVTPLLVDDFDNKWHVVAYGQAEITSQDRDLSLIHISEPTRPY